MAAQLLFKASLEVVGCQSGQRGDSADNRLHSVSVSKFLLAHQTLHMRAYRNTSLLQGISDCWSHFVQFCPMTLGAHICCCMSGKSLTLSFVLPCLRSTRRQLFVYQSLPAENGRSHCHESSGVSLIRGSMVDKTGAPFIVTKGLGSTVPATAFQPATYTNIIAHTIHTPPFLLQS